MVIAKIFKKGQEVRLVKNLGVRSGLNEKNYFYSGSINEVALNTRAVVREIIERNKKIGIATVEGKYWYVHPDEISSFTQTITALPGIERLERHPLFEMSVATPLVVIEGKVYAQGEKASEENKPTTFLVDERKDVSALEEIGTLSSLDQMYLGRNETAIAEMQKFYSTEVQERLGLKEKLGKLDDSDLPSLIASQVFPYLREEGYKTKIAGMLGVASEGVPKEANAPKRESKERNSSLEKLVDEILVDVSALKSELDSEPLHEQEEQKDERSAKQKMLDVLLGVEPLRQDKLYSEPLENQNFIISNGQISYLSPTSGRNRRIVNVNGTDYKLEDSAESSEQAEGDQRRLTSQEIRKATLDTHFSKEKMRELAESKIGELSAFTGLRDYDAGEFGFTSREGSERLFLWIRIPPWVVKSQYDGNYYRFGSNRAGFYVNKSGSGRISRDSEAKAIENNDHPFLHRKSGSFTEICLGSYSLSISGKDKGESIAKSLRQIKSVLLYGYNASNYDYNYRLTTSQFPNNLISEKEAKSLGVPIIIGGAN
ncbi:MAG: hypothetical protein WCI72_00880 [archaeon]